MDFDKIMQEARDLVEDWRVEGRIAFAIGETRNPYEVGTPPWRGWQQGYEEAAAAARKAS